MFEFKIVAESPLDQKAITTLADRVMCEEMPWIRDTLDSQRRWSGLESTDPYLDWHKVHQLARHRGIRVMGKFGGEGGHVTRKALRLLQTCDPLPDAVVLFLDVDRHADRIAGVREAVAELTPPFPIVVSVANCAREHWILTAFEPRDSYEERLLRDLKERLGFDPYDDLLALRSPKRGDPRCPKTIVKELLQTDSIPEAQRGPELWLQHREAACYLNTPIELIQQRETLLYSRRREDTGLWRCIQDIRTSLVPVLAGHRSRPR